MNKLAEQMVEQRKTMKITKKKTGEERAEKKRQKEGQKKASTRDLTMMKLESERLKTKLLEVDRCWGKMMDNRSRRLDEGTVNVEQDLAEELEVVLMWKTLEQDTVDMLRRLISRFSALGEEMKGELEERARRRS